MTTAKAAIRMAKNGSIRRTIAWPPLGAPGARKKFGALAGPSPARLGPRRGAGRKPPVEIGADPGHQRLELAVEEVVGAGHDLLLDHDALLRLELLDEAGHVLLRHHGILIAVDDQTRGRAGGQEREVVEIGRRR